jgi:FtsP/CotA-like multicopper oxidase with cupredoxin domain
MSQTQSVGRRSFLKAVGVGGAASVTMAGIGLGIGWGAKEASEPVREGGGAHGGGDTDHQEGEGGEMTADEMDLHHEEVIKQFPQATAAKGGLPLEFSLDGETKVFELTCDIVQWEFRVGQTEEAWGYNGMLPGPEIRVTEGDRVRVNVTNNLTQSTSVHFHGQMAPTEMDGVPFITQPPIKPGESFTYEFTAAPAGTHMYHSHHNSMEQVSMGLLGAFIVDPLDPASRPSFDREYSIVMNDTLHGFTINGKSFPATEPLVCKLGETVMIRYLNEGMMNHPFHLHGMPMQVIAKDGYLLPQPFLCDTIDVAPGNRYEVLVHADNPGVWAFHCHILSHAEGRTGMFGMVTALIVEDDAAAAAFPVMPAGANGNRYDCEVKPLA